MKDKNGIEMTCENCAPIVAWICPNRDSYPCKTDSFLPSPKAYETRIEELQNSLDETEKKLTETVKLLGERSRECGELEAYNEVLQRRIREFSMELLDQNMRDNKDVLERLKNWEEYLDKDVSTQSTDAADVSKNGENSAESEESHLDDFTIEEIDFTKKAISMAIFDCETNPPKPSDENLKLMWSIKSKCDAILKANVRENRTLKESEER